MLLQAFQCPRLHVSQYIQSIQTQVNSHLCLTIVSRLKCTVIHVPVNTGSRVRHHFPIHPVNTGSSVQSPLPDHCLVCSHLCLSTHPVNTGSRVRHHFPIHPVNTGSSVQSPFPDHCLVCSHLCLSTHPVNTGTKCTVAISC